eukprot:c7477_g1_i1.p1 GENE.c7477_g1_i1~~c7477_g1_i1.p1  ORF type:complete len:491 (-),score=96.02 c7477_g1_i1:142-1497(-)
MDEFVPSSDQISEVRIVVCGNVDAGKSTLLGVLTKGELDNGRGKARSNVFRHKHEIETGRTSSVGSELLGIDENNEFVNYNVAARRSGWSDICSRSSRVLLFLDLAGHERYLKTTVFGMTGNYPDACMMLIAANNGVLSMTKEHFHLALALKLPVFIVISKIDICPENILKQTVEGLVKMLKAPGSKKLPIFVRSEEDLQTACQNFGGSDRVCPIFLASSVTGESLDLLRGFLKMLKSRHSWHAARSNPPEYHIDETYTVPGVGTVVAGTLINGIVKVNDNLLLGPDGFGQFNSVTIKGIHTNCMPVMEVYAGQSCSFALKKVKRKDVRKGMVMVDPVMKPIAFWEFEAEVLIITHATTIGLGYQSVIHCGVTRQAAQIVQMNTDVIRSGTRSQVRFRFMYRPEYMKADSMLIFREGKTKGIGKINRLVPSEEELGLGVLRPPKPPHPAQS